MFAIAFDKITHILSKFNKIEYTLYADDVFIFTKTTDLNIVANTFREILNELSKWGTKSGANISFQKTNTFHICNKTNCSNITLTYNNINITNVNTLRFLGIIFDKKYTFKDHCLYVRNNIINKLNIIKFLSSKHCHVHPTTLLQITKALILSKIEYGLPIYGKCATSHIKLLFAPYHSAVKRSLHAFPTSPTRNVLAEGGLPSIKSQISMSTLNLIPKIYICQNSVLRNDLNNLRKRKTTPKKISTIAICKDFMEEHEFNFLPYERKPSNYAPWTLKETSFILDLANLEKKKHKQYIIPAIIFRN